MMVQLSVDAVLMCKPRRKIMKYPEVLLMHMGPGTDCRPLFFIFCASILSGDA
jgi:hypothetical protein